MSAGRIVAVIGMHRSGTSAITRGLDALGVALGERLMPASPGINEKGFWEDVDIHELSESLLRHLGREWHDTTPIDGEDLTGPELAPFVDQAVRLLRTKMAGVSAFGMKNPRTGRLLPFWERVFAALGVEAGYVIALRHPLSVADSLAARNGFEPEKSYLLWLQHMLSSLLGSAGRPRLVVNYDRLMDDPEHQLRRIARALNLPFDPASAQFAAYAHDFLDERLRHSRYGAEHLSGVPDEVAEACRLLDRLAADELPMEAVGCGTAFLRLAVRMERVAPCSAVEAI